MFGDTEWLGLFWTIAALPILIILVRNRMDQNIISLFLSFRKRSKKAALINQLNGFKKELAQISQVNEFAKHSKIVRKMRAAKDELNAIKVEEMSLNVKLVYLIYYRLMSHWLDWTQSETSA